MGRRTFGAVPEKRGPKRSILWVVKSWDVSRLGNPRYYFVFLDCGHTQMRYHGPHTVMTYIAWTIAESGTSATFPQARCEDCKNELAPDYYDMCVYSHLPLEAMGKHEELRKTWDAVKDMTKKDVSRKK